MTITNCPKCGSMNITTAGVCANCGWSQFAQVTTVSTGVYKTIGEIEIKETGKALLDDYKRLLFEIRSLTERIAELEEEQVILKDQQREAKNHLIDKRLHIDSLYEEGYKLQKHIAKLEAENDQLTAHDATERQDDKCSKPEPNVCEACGGDGTVLLTDGYKGQVIATAKCIYCNGTGRVNKEREE